MQKAWSHIAGGYTFGYTDKGRNLNPQFISPTPGRWQGVNMLRNIHQEEQHSIKTYQEEYEDYIVKHGFVKHKE
jgi:hypothetical protein